MRFESLLRDSPTQIETLRLVIRCPKPGDGAAVFAGVSESLVQLREFSASLPWAMFEPSLDGSEKHCREGQIKYLQRTEMPMLLFLKEGNVYAGGSGLHSFDWSVGSCRVCERAGFKLEGILRNERSDSAGVLRDTRVYAVTN